MCEEYPGPRCSFDAAKKVASRRKRLNAALAAHSPGSAEVQIASARLVVAELEYAATPDGIAALRRAVEEGDAGATQHLQAAEATRNAQIAALKEKRLQRPALLSEVMHAANPFYDAHEYESIIDSHRRTLEQHAGAGIPSHGDDADDSPYTSYLDYLESNLPADASDSTRKALETLRALPAPEKFHDRMYAALPSAVRRSKQALAEELRAIATLQGVSPKVAAAYYDGYRQQYLAEYAHLSKAERPDPPEAWVVGEFPGAGYTGSRSKYAPHDPASVYAAYRLRSDDAAIPDYMKHTRLESHISIDPDSQGLQVDTYRRNGKLVSNKTYPQTPESQQQVSQLLQGNTVLSAHPAETQELLHHRAPYLTGETRMLNTRDYTAKHFDLPSPEPRLTAALLPPEETKNLHRPADLHYAERRYAMRTWSKKRSRAAAPPLTTLPTTERWKPAIQPIQRRSTAGN